MKVVCAWCKASIHEDTADDDEDTAVSHGICEGCLPGIVEEIGVPMDEFLDSLAPPIIVVQHNRRILAANSAAKALMSKSHNKITGQLGGYALGCIHADESNACGQKLHCMSCAIKNSIMHTLTTGEPLSNVPASSELSLITGIRIAQFLISTKKVSDFVLVTIKDLLDTEELASPKEAIVM